LIIVNLTTANPPLWTKPAAALAAPDEDIPVNKFCASSFPDYEVNPSFNSLSLIRRHFSFS
jgi:hypothetical protein